MRPTVYVPAGYFNVFLLHMNEYLPTTYLRYLG